MVLVDAHGLVGAEDADRARQADPGRARRRRRQHRRIGRDNVVGAVMLTHAEPIEADLVGEFDLLDQLLDPLLGGWGASRLGIRTDVPKAV